ncbi:unnamed protein product [Didymodactylos carnosus]|uniref:CRIB domain-containing protein n=1 Tax=Didymodactylos carnosus TaxID=1234261 RepID=A0A813V8I7_9BILA|nr:unnamed protein product [Didymodactylos carnosus]CAF0839762.1 unnamed protein product [Didymodactylos carnosus]CAF3534583.1 unnamed protein product [Didymodactylos carnosus]CAF3627106.1 unnamed protein product [Didymodactylos carnosus]
MNNPTSFILYPSSQQKIRLQSRWSLDSSPKLRQQQIVYPTTTTVSDNSYANSYFYPKQQSYPIDYETNTSSGSFSVSVSQKNHYPTTIRYDRPNSTTVNKPTFNVGELRHRYEDKTVVVVKPLINRTKSQSHAELISDDQHDSIKNEQYLSNTSNLQLNDDKRFGQIFDNNIINRKPPSYPNALCLTPSSTPVVYRSKPPLPIQPPVVPRRHSSISNRTSRTVSTSSCSTLIPDSLHSILSRNQPEDFHSDVEIDVKKIELFYGSVGTLVKASRSMAHLYTTTTKQMANFEDWSCQQRGIPVLIYNTGANLKRLREIKIILVENGSCFTVWTCLVSQQSEIRLPKEGFVTCWLPQQNMLAVFKFDKNDACRLFFRQYHEILERERKLLMNENHQLPPKADNREKTPRRYSKIRSTARSSEPKVSSTLEPTFLATKNNDQNHELRRCRSLSKIRLIKKSAISGPVNFEHVSHIANNNRNSITISQLGGISSLRCLHSSTSNISAIPDDGYLSNRLFYLNKRASAYEPRTTEV